MEIQKEKNLESWDYFVPVPCLSRTKYILLIVLLSVGCFIISIDGQFVFDDSEAIVNNKDVKLTTPIGELFYNDFWGTRMNHSQSHKSYRPITILSFRFNTWLNNGILSPYQFRLLNILLHCIVCLLSKNVFELLMGGNCCKAANLCDIIFSIHPIHTEAGICFIYDVWIVNKLNVVNIYYHFLVKIILHYVMKD
ncbi:protein O-mannosyl-transferase TMTC4-like [Lycorma delicatula]|uniref:protein O-mannosyl-transferase TMTC4-like n=1 Tax=Lycorma delicatula TaxID=130591 RepID=UPI003F510F31